MDVERGASSSSADVRVTKRKLDEAFHKLDAAVASKETLVDQPPPTKKPFLARSIYSTLAKYGIKSKDSHSSKSSLGTNFGSLSKSTPHLTAILSRAASRTRNTFAHRDSPAPLSPLADYRPSSIPSFLNRLSTFKLSTYANKPPQIDAVAAAKCGWINDGKDRLVCGICNVSWVLANKDGMTRDAANALIEKQRVSLVEAHKNGCPWRTRQCDDLIYRIPLQSPTVTVRELKKSALSLDHLVHSVEVKHPLTQNQVTSLQSIIFSYELPHENEEPETAEASSSTSPPAPSNPSTTAVLIALFGWTPAPERPRTMSSRSASRVTTPSLSRASSVAPSNANIPHPNLLRNASTKIASRDTSLLHCVLCQRRVGLWAFAPPPSSASEAAPAPEGTQTANISRSAQKQRQFDLLKEHRSYCPYVVRSTPLPTLPIPSPSSVSVNTSSHTRTSSSTSQLNGIGANGGAMEGWRAVLTVVLRYKMTQRYQGGRRQRGEDGNIPEGDDGMEVDFEAMIEGVKSRGGKDLLRYVKGLLG
ncbi:hypothetical protein Moror_8130 [Moniliophthora roreri MCA 2997]|uniref:Zf-C3HC-domain-containing protein n=1 Tax=Moniliophthora roreri (strain MCA 2997) TaxID=1381753 RepID=V2XL55_MONRO|nr:hypothetical protein Moror_8130 [Moniliophthora roreri MCA 2997]